MTIRNKAARALQRGHQRAESGTPSLHDQSSGGFYKPSQMLGHSSLLKEESMVNAAQSLTRQ